MADESPIVEETGSFDVLQGNGGVDSAAKAEICDRKFGVFRVGAAVLNNLGNADNRCVTHAVIDKNEVAGFHLPDGAKGLWISDAIPDGFNVPLKRVDRVRFGVGFG